MSKLEIGSSSAQSISIPFPLEPETIATPQSQQEIIDRVQTNIDAIKGYQKILLETVRTASHYTGDFLDVLHLLLRQECFQSKAYVGRMAHAVSKLSLYSFVVPILDGNGVSRETAILWAAEKGDSIFMQKLLIEYQNLEESTRGDAFQIAFNQDNIGSMCLLLESGPIPQQDRDYWIVQPSDSVIVTGLIANGPISSDVIAKVIVDAAKSGEIGLLDLLLASKHTLHIAVGEDLALLEDAIRSTDRLDVLDLLLKQEDIVTTIIFYASKTGKLDLLKMVLKDRNISDRNMLFALVFGHSHIPIANRAISENSRGILVQVASYFSYLLVLKELLATGSISERARGDAVQIASERKAFSVLKELLATGSVTEKARGDAVCVASKDGEVAMVELLLANGSISQEARGDAVCSASKHGEVAMIELLLANGSISQEARASAIQMASENSHSDVVQRLLGSDEMRREWIRSAAKEGNLSLLNMLLGKNTADGEYALYIAARYGHLSIIGALLAGRSISQEAKILAARIAATNQHVSIQQLLLGENR